MKSLASGVILKNTVHEQRSDLCVAQQDRKCVGRIQRLFENVHAPQAAADGQYELFKTTSHFDSTAMRPEWLGGETESVRRLAS